MSEVHNEMQVEEVCKELTAAVSEATSLVENNVDAIAVSQNEESEHDLSITFSDWVDGNEEAKTGGAILTVPNEIVAVWSAGEQAVYCKTMYEHNVQISQPLMNYIIQNYAHLITADMPGGCDIALHIIKEFEKGNEPQYREDDFASDENYALKS